jgi:hypothetical protein
MDGQPGDKSSGDYRASLWDELNRLSNVQTAGPVRGEEPSPTQLKLVPFTTDHRSVLEIHFDRGPIGLVVRGVTAFVVITALLCVATIVVVVVMTSVIVRTSFSC